MEHAPPAQSTPPADRTDTPATPSGPAGPDWWRDPRLPWTGRPTRADLLCWGGIGAAGWLMLVLLPFRPVLLAQNPLALAALSGSRTVMVTLGALASVGRMDLWWLGLLLGTLSQVKFDPLYWWAGRLWGQGLLRVLTGSSSPRAARNAARAERLAARWGVTAILLTYVVPVLPSPVVSASVGAAGMSLRTFLLAQLTGSFVTRCLYLYLGYRIGQPIVDVLQTVDRYLLWVSLGLLVVVVAGVVRGSRARSA